MKSKLNREEIEKILESYEIGRVVSIKELKRRLESLQPSFIIETAEDKFFLKQYRALTPSIRQGLKLNLFLQNNDYPCNKVIVSSQGKPFSKYNKTAVAVFEYLPYEWKREINNKECFEYGKGLPKLHQTSKKYEGNINKKYTPKYFFNKYREQYSLAKKAPQEYRDGLERIREEYKRAIEVIKGLPKGICHSEYTLEHVRFHKNELVAVMDWDLVTKTYYVYDIGTAIAVFIDKNEIDFEKIRTFLKGYESVRGLEEREKKNFYEAVELGVFKFITWGLDEDEIEANGWESVGISSGKNLITSKEKFKHKIYT